MRLLMLLFAIAASAAAQAFPTIAARTAGWKKLDGYFPLYYDEHAGALHLEIDKWNTEFLYVDSLPAGVGSNDIGLDRGQIGNSRVARFERSGPKVLLVQWNYRYRSTSVSAAEREAAEEAFARSVLGGFIVEAEEGSRVLVDATAFFLQDPHEIPETLLREKQGKYKLDPARCALYLPRTKAFPKNTEVEATLTFAGEEAGPWVRDVVPTPNAITVREHHSFVELPDGNYHRRAFDPRAGYFPLTYADYSTPINVPVQTRWITRHRLVKKDPGAAVSEPVQPIVYYLDPGTPEPVRSALLEGGNWWSAAFEAAGFRNAFKVVMLPEDADPMDVRYNVIQWVHRSTRGWSYGESVTDPRTGEIIKGQVTLGSLRVRQDYLIAQGLAAEYEEGRPENPEMSRMALARLRQLAAHEIGHTLGLSHNYIASAEGRASVMDYPPPYLKLDGGGNIDLGEAYATGIGEWDKVAIDFGYRAFAAGADEHLELDRILLAAAKRKLIFLTDEDARPQGSAHPQNHLWDSGADAAAELERVLLVRAKAIAKFDERRIRRDEPMSSLEDVLVPVYMLHRYQTEAAVKVLGGLDYTYALRGDGQLVTAIVAPEQQRRALQALLKTIQPETLAIPERILKMIPPRAHGYPRTREDFRSHTGLTFDALAAAESAADLTVGLMLNPERASRLVEYHARDAANPGLDEVLDSLLKATWFAERTEGWPGEVARAVDNVVLYRLMALAASDTASEEARASAWQALGKIDSYVSIDAEWTFAKRQIELFRRDPKSIPVTKPVDAPDGPPI